MGALLLWTLHVVAATLEILEMTVRNLGMEMSEGMELIVRSLGMGFTQGYGTSSFLISGSTGGYPQNRQSPAEPEEL